MPSEQDTNDLEIDRAGITQGLLEDLSYGNLLQTIRSPDRREQQLQQIQQKLDALPKSNKPMPQAMQPSEILTALANLNVADPDMLEDFLEASQAQSHEYLPEPIPIGTHDGVQYFIMSFDETIDEDPSSITILQANRDDVYNGIAVYEAQSISRASDASSAPIAQTINTDLKYGFGIGTLWHKFSNDSEMEETGFYVICNAVDKSIWIAFDFEPYGETGEINSVKPERGDPYGELPLDTDKMTIGIMRLFDKAWMLRQPLSLDGGDPFRDGAGIPIACRLVAKPAFVADVRDAIETSTG